MTMFTPTLNGGVEMTIYGCIAGTPYSESAVDGCVPFNQKRSLSPFTNGLSHELMLA